VPSPFGLAILTRLFLADLFEPRRYYDTCVTLVAAIAAPDRIGIMPMASEGALADAADLVSLAFHFRMALGVRINSGLIANAKLHRGEF
jgi:hypothetical protein